MYITSLRCNEEKRDSQKSDNIEIYRIFVISNSCKLSENEHWDEMVKSTKYLYNDLHCKKELSVVKIVHYVYANNNVNI